MMYKPRALLIFETVPAFTRVRTPSTAIHRGRQHAVNGASDNATLGPTLVSYSPSVIGSRLRPI